MDLEKRARLEELKVQGWDANLFTDVVSMDLQDELVFYTPNGMEVFKVRDLLSPEEIRKAYREIVGEDKGALIGLNVNPKKLATVLGVRIEERSGTRVTTYTPTPQAEA